MGADLFGSFAEATIASLVIGSKYFSDTGDGGCFYYPLIISSFGIVGSFFTSFAATKFMTVNQYHKIDNILKWQLIISTIIITPLIYLAAVISLPTNFTINGNNTPTEAFYCTILGLWGGLIFGYHTDYVTSF